ncbi:MAG TPA: hypothetical protein VGA99_07180 [bacterium]
MKTFVRLIAFFFPVLAFAQTNIWIKLDVGTALYLEPSQMQWIPVSEKQELPAKSYLMTRPGVRARLFRNTDEYTLPANAYFFIEDVFSKSRVEIVACLTQIEAEQLPVNNVEPGNSPQKTLGLTYGQTPNEEKVADGIPFEMERLNAINWFYENARLDAALLSLKRMMTKFPNLYLSEYHVERLLHLYNELQLYGFLLDESTRLLNVRKSEKFSQIVASWHQIARKNLLEQKAK